jgi:hypothetical protein
VCQAALLSERCYDFVYNVGACLTAPKKPFGDMEVLLEFSSSSSDKHHSVIQGLLDFFRSGRVA